MTERITEDVHDEASTPHRDARNGPSCFFTPVENSVFTTKALTTKARQILLTLELKAGTSRIAKISQREIAALTGYSLRTVERSLHSLREQEWITQADAGVLQLEKPTPGRCYVPVYESVVHHPDWEDWQKHLLLFVMSQFRGRDQEFGVSLYTVNLYGRKGDSIERCCRIPGSTTQRRRTACEFVEQLEDEGIVRVVEDATSNRPAICTVDRNMLENIQPDFERHRSATCRVTGPPKNPHRHASRSNTVTRHVAHRHSSRSKPVTPHVATPSSVTYVKDPKDSEDSKKIPESPPACGGRGAISSRARVPASGDDREFGYGTSEVSRTETDFGHPISEVLGESLAVGDDLTSLMKSKSHRQLTRDVEFQCYGFRLTQSRVDRHSLVGNWSDLLQELPQDVESGDVVAAIQSSHFDGLGSLSWGLLLSEKFVRRFFVEIKTNYDERNRLTRSTEELFDKTVENLNDKEPASRQAAIERLGTFGNDTEVVRLILGFLVGERRDSDPAVRLVAVERLVYLVSCCEIDEEGHELILGGLSECLDDEDGAVRNEVEYLQSLIADAPSPA